MKIHFYSVRFLFHFILFLCLCGPASVTFEAKMDDSGDEVSLSPLRPGESTRSETS